MWNCKFLGFEIFYLFYHFFLYSFFGWIYESCFVSLKNKEFVNRGFLNGPVIPIYGAGATVIMIVLEPIKNNYVAIFFGGMLVASVLEFCTSWLMEKLFHAKWWDYSEWKFNLQGRICLAASFFWGVLSVSMELFFKPGMDKLIADIPRTVGEYAGYVIAFVFFSDLTITVVSTVQLDKKLAELQRLRTELAGFLENSRLADMTESFISEWKMRISESRYTELLGSIRVRLDEMAKEHENEKTSLPGFREWREELEEHARSFVSRYQSKLEKRNIIQIIQNRLLMAFPDMKSAGREEVLRDWRSRLQGYRNQKKKE